MLKKSSIDQTSITSFIKSLLIDTLDQYNFPLYEILSQQFRKINQTILFNKKLSGMLSLYNKNKGNFSEEYKIEIARLLSQFKCFGRVKKEGALLTCAQVKTRKNDQFNPIILNKSEFAAYLKKISSGKEDFRERFIIVGIHWVAGDIERKNGVVKLLLSDSLGQDQPELTLNDLLPSYFAVIPKNSYAFIPKIKRLNADLGCSIFALDDLIHFFTLENKIGMNLFDYFKKNLSAFSRRKFDISGKNYFFFEVKMPLALLRNWQSSKLFTYIDELPTEERQASINGQGKTVEQHLDRYFQEKNGRKINTGLGHKREKLAEENAIFLLTHSEEHAKEIMDSFNLSSQIKSKASLTNK